MYDLKVDLGLRSYKILINENLIKSIGTELKSSLNRDQVWIISDCNVLKYYKNDLVRSFEDENIKLNLFELPSGEGTKSISFLEKIADWLFETGIERRDLIIAFGGGVIGDLVGFSSAITLRGINFVQIPTTLLAQVDSSVGGKTGINSKFGKNLLGSFYQPKKVIIDVNTLETLPERELKSGYSEIVKYGLLGDYNFFEWLENNGRGVLSLNKTLLKEAIQKSCSIKADIVKQDELEFGPRALLNLGHTFGHALEVATGYTDKLLHGEAVSIGIILAFEISSKMKFCSIEASERVRKHFNEMGLKSKLSEVDFSFPSTDELIKLMLMDKKVNDGLINFVMVKDIGFAFVTNSVDLSVIKIAINESRGF